MRKILSYCRPSFSLENVKGSSNYKIIKSGISLNLAFQLGAMTRRDCHVALLLAMTAMLFSFNAHSACTPTPDCASIGYTEISCEGASLKCPFDISKLYCIPCDSSFRYDCSGDNISEGTGSACGGKYVSCTCSSTDYIFSNGSCDCDTSCKVGAIYYSDGTCSACLDTNKTPVGVVVKDNELIMSKIIEAISWGGYGTNISGITDISDKAIAIQDFNGKANTLAIVSQITNGTTSDNAAIYCNEYLTDGTSAGDWYLPAAGELYKYVYNNYYMISSTMDKLTWVFGGRWFWSSCELSYLRAWYVHSSNGAINHYDRAGNSSAMCFLEIK